MSALYVAKFEDGTQYCVDDSGTRWTFEEGEVVCESCGETVNGAYVDEYNRFILCKDCHDIKVVIEVPDGHILIDEGAGQMKHVPELVVCAMGVKERYADGYVILGITNDDGEESMWREITIGGCVYGYAYEGEVDPDDSDC